MTPNKYLKKIMFVYFVYSLICVFAGKRADVIISVLLIAWLYNKYIKKINFRTLITVAIAVLLLSVYMVGLRSNESNIRSQRSIADEGSSIYVIGLTIDNEEVLLSEQCNEYHIPYIFGILIKDITAIYYRIIGAISPFSQGQTLDTLKHSAYLGWELTYLIRPSSFLSGYGVGSSYVAEAYLSGGIIGIYLWTLIIFYIVSKSSLANGPVGKIFELVTFNSFIMMPRGNFFNFVMTFVYTVLIVYVFRFIGSIRR